MIELSKASEARLYFDAIIKEMQGIKIIAVFSSCPSFSHLAKFRRYLDDAPIYILFEDGRCLIIDYRFVDALCVERRTLNEKEKAVLEELPIKDYFNCSVDIHGWVANAEGTPVVGDTDRTETISLKYADLTTVEFRRVTEEYSKWIDGDLDYAKPTEETFDEMKFIMSNGNTFTICADDAMSDGYVRAWSVNAQEAII